MMMSFSRPEPPPVGRNKAKAFGAGALVGALGGLIGLGGAEFRLPLLIGWFQFAALEAVILNKAMSLVVVTAALPFRAGAVPLDAVFASWPVILTLLAGSLPGAYVGAGLALRLDSASLHRTMALLLVLIAGALLLGHDRTDGRALLTGTGLLLAGILAGFGIGVVASLLGVAGGELLIPTLVLLFGVDVKLAGSLSLAVSLPTMLVGFARYSRDQSFAVLRTHAPFVITMAAGSLVGVWLGGQLLGIVPHALLLPGLALILVVSAVRVTRHH